MEGLHVKLDGTVDQCPICGEPVNSSVAITGSQFATLVVCQRCGNYQITREALLNLKNASLTERQQANMSGWLYENDNTEITTASLEVLINIKAPSFQNRADKFLLAIEKRTTLAGQRVKQEPSWLSASWCFNNLEWVEIREYLASKGMINYDGAGYKILPNGWIRLDELRKINADSEQCFVAMWFDDRMKPIYDNIISKGIENAGYRPHKVDQREHNDKIDDEIIAQIKRSRFIIADFTGHRGGVYYEAGFAKGLGLDVIWTCCKSDIDSLHFDIRQYNCIDWEEDKLPEFKKRLTNRIEAVLGRGNYKA